MVELDQVYSNLAREIHFRADFSSNQILASEFFHYKQRRPSKWYSFKDVVPVFFV